MEDTESPHGDNSNVSQREWVERIKEISSYARVGVDSVVTPRNRRDVSEEDMPRRGRSRCR